MIVRKIFEESYFSVMPFELSKITGLLAVSKKFNVKNYFLVLFIEDSDLQSDFLRVNIPEYTSLLKKLLEDYYDGSVLKNTSLLLCCKSNDVIAVDSLIYEIEEDPYDFKKYVLIYTKNQVQQLIKKWEETQTESIVHFLNKELKNTVSFDEFKQSPFEDTGYNLITRLFIKIPFLTIDIQPKEFEHLPSKIDEQLVQVNEKDFRNLLKEISDLDENLIIEKLLEESVENE